MISYFKDIFVFVVGVLGMVLTGLTIMSWSPMIHLRSFDTLRRAGIRQLQDSAPSECRPHTNIVLLKTHKTGGSTLQNIVYRFGDRRNLTFALPASENYFASPRLFDKSSVLKLPGASTFNILANHARYNTKGFGQVMPDDTIYITSIRHPASQYESMYQYYKFSNRFHVPIRIFAKDPLKFYSKSKTKFKTLRQSGVNPMLFDLGLNKRFLQDMTRIKHKVRNIEDKFRFVLIAEYFDESLVLMKDLFCWSLEDVAYFKVNARVEEEVEELEEDTKLNLTLWNEGDMYLYTFFNRTLWKRIHNYGYERLRAEVAELRKMMERLQMKCLKDGHSVKRSQGGKTIVLKYKAPNVSGSSEDSFICGALTRKPMDYLKLLKEKMIAMYG